MRRQCFLTLPFKILVCQRHYIHASTLYTKLKTFVILLLFVSKLTTFSFLLTLNTFQLQTFFINFFIITQTIKNDFLSAECLTVSKLPTVSKIHFVSREPYCQQSAFSIPSSILSHYPLKSN